MLADDFLVLIRLLDLKMAIELDLHLPKADALATAGGDSGLSAMKWTRPPFRQFVERGI